MKLKQLFISVEHPKYACELCGKRSCVIETKRLSGDWRVSCTQPDCFWTTGWRPPPLV